MQKTKKSKINIRKRIHKFILWYLEKKCGGGFHTGEYKSPEGRYVKAYTDEDYEYIQKLQILDMYRRVDWSFYNKNKKKGNGKEMRKLQTIQTQENLNEIYAIDEIGPGGANHLYRIGATIDSNKLGQHNATNIQMQKGPRNLVSSVHGVIDSDLLEIVRDRLTSFQNGEFACEYNAEALEHVEKALEALNRRVEDRINRNVLGKNEQ